MFTQAYINNHEEAIRFCDRYNIPCTMQDGILSVTEPPLSCHAKFAEMQEVAMSLEGFQTDHPNCYLSNNGHLIVTFSNYDAKLTEASVKKARRKGYDIRESGFDLYGHGTTTYVMAELVSPLDEG